jgi:hypothetical protein
MVSIPFSSLILSFLVLNCFSFNFDLASNNANDNDSSSAAHLDTAMSDDSGDSDETTDRLSGNSLFVILFSLSCHDYSFCLPYIPSYFPSIGDYLVSDVTHTVAESNSLFSNGRAVDSHYNGAKPTTRAPLHFASRNTNIFSFGMCLFHNVFTSLRLF